MVKGLPLLLLLSACSWSIDPATIPCDSDGACPPNWHCDVDAGRCALGPGDDDDSGDDDDDDTPDDDDVTPDDDDTPPDDDDDTPQDDDDSDAALAVTGERYCMDWSTGSIANNPLGLLDTNILGRPLLIHFESVSEANLDVQTMAGGTACTPHIFASPADFQFFERSWSFTPGSGHFSAGPISQLTLATIGGPGPLYDATLTGTYNEATDTFVDGTLDGELYITPALDQFQIECSAAPDCHPCPGLFDEGDCITLGVTDLVWTHSGSGSF